MPIRAADLSDIASIFRCVKHAYQHYIERIGIEPGPMLTDYSAALVQHQMFVYESPDNGVVGMLLMIESNEEMLMDTVSVLPDSQGLGIGGELIAFAEQLAEKQGFESLLLYTNELMTENLTMYAGMGYTEVKRVKEHGFNRVYMSKPLTDAKAQPNA